jgi:hypothetical protein
MTRTLALAALGLFALAPIAWAGKDKEPKLEEYTSDAGKYRVKFPGKPKAESKELGSGPAAYRRSRSRPSGSSCRKARWCSR